MHVKFDALDRFEVPQFTVCNPGSTYNNDMPSRVIGILTGTDSEELILNFNATSELNLRANKISSDIDEVNAYLQTVYKSLQNRRMIFIDNVGYFIINKVVDGFDGEHHYKDITAESCESEIRNKQLSFVKDGKPALIEGTYKFSELLEGIVLTLPLWTIGEVDSAVSEKHRSFEDVSENLNTLAFMLENMQDAYECIFVFDCINRKINVYDQNNYVKLTNIQISKEDVIKSLNITESSDDLYTALSVISDENVGIQAVNPLGTGVIYNFKYYLDWMSDALRARVEEWTALIETSEQEYYELNLEYYNKKTEHSNKEADVDKLQTQITMYDRCRDNVVASGNTSEVKKYNESILQKCLICVDGVINEACTICNGKGFIPDKDIEIYISEDVEETLASIDTLISKANANRQSILAEIEALESELEELESEIAEIRIACKIEEYFTEEEYNELSNYIYEGIYNDEYVIITDKMTYDERFQQMKTLYDRAKSQLLRVSYPTQEFDLDVENFIFEKNFEAWSEQLETGVLINVELDVDDIAALFLSNITVNYDDRKLTMKFGNRFNKYDPKALFEKILGDIQKSSNSINFIKDVLYPIKNGEYDAFKEFAQNSRTLTKNAVLASTNQSIVIDDTGYTGRKIDEKGNVDPHQIKINNNTIVFTKDGWETCSTAVGMINLPGGETTYGINAKTVIGEVILGNTLQIYEGKTPILEVMDNKITTNLEDVNGNISSLQQTAESLTAKFESNINSVKTITGYTFDADGLRIYNSGSDIENKINNSGMYVSRLNGDESEIVLSADANGVNAIDIAVKNFLIIGKHTRFEDYVAEDGEEKTAAFWI